MRPIKLISLFISAAVAISPPGKYAKNLRYDEGQPSAVLGSLKQDAEGFIAVGSDGVLRSFAANNRSVIDYRQLDYQQHSAFFHVFLYATRDPGFKIFDDMLFADGREVLHKRRLFEPKADRIPNVTNIELPADEDEVHDPIEDMGEHFDHALACSPPIYCTNSGMCSGGCSTCTFVSFFPYGICMHLDGEKKGRSH